MLFFGQKIIGTYGFLVSLLVNVGSELGVRVGRVLLGVVAVVAVTVRVVHQF